MKLSPVLPRRSRTKKDKGRASLRAVIGLALVGLLALLVNVYSVPPDWWAARGVLDAQQVQDQNAAVNVGQLKAMAAKAMDEMDAKFPGGAGTAIHALVQDWRDNKLQHDQSASLNVGQLKAVAKPYYDRLVEVGARPANAGYPWPSNSPTADNNALVNAGQVKNVFSFTIPLINDTDTDGDGMPDGWELANGLNPALDDSLEDNDGDRVPNLFEFKRGTLANDPNSKPIATLVVDPAMGGASTTDNIYSTIKEALAQAALPANAYAVIEVKSGVYAEQVLLNGTTPVLLLGELGNVQGPPVIIGSLASSSYAMVISNASVVDGFIIAHVPGRTGGGVAATATAGSLTPRRRLINCVIRGNENSLGGGIFSNRTKLDVVHCTLTGNKSNSSGRAIYNGNACTLNLVNSIVWGNTGNALQEIYNAAGSIVTVTGGSVPAIPTSIIAGGEHGGINVDPQLTPVGWLKSSSPAINRIGVAVAMASRVDIHGEPRPTVGTTPDLGADEFKDSNGDGLPDWLEGADDNDGLAALDEYLIYGTSPLLADTDGDGVSDGVEIAQGTNPLDDYYHAQPPILKFVGGGNQWGVAGTVLATPVSLSVNNGAINAPVTFTASNGGLISADGVSNWQSSLPMLSSVVSRVAQVFVKLPDGIGSSSVITASVYTGRKAITIGTWVATLDPALSPPTNVIATPIASDTVRLNWTPSDLTKATTIELSLDGGATWLAVGVASAGLTTAIITDVPSDTATIVRVQTGGTPTDGGGGGGGLMFSILAKIAAMTPLPDSYSPELIASSYTALSKPKMLMESVLFFGTKWGHLGFTNKNNSYLTEHTEFKSSLGETRATTNIINPMTGGVNGGSYIYYNDFATPGFYNTGITTDTKGTNTTNYGTYTTTVTDELSDLYPMEQFITNVESWVPPFQNQFIPPIKSIPEGFYDAFLSNRASALIELIPPIRSGDTTLNNYYSSRYPNYVVSGGTSTKLGSYIIKKLQYRWQVNSDPSVVVNWLEVFTPSFDVTAPIVVTPKTWANTEGEAQSPVFTIDPTVEKKNGTYKVVQMEVNWEKVGDNWDVEDNKDPDGNWMSGRGKRMFVDAKSQSETTMRDTIYVKVTGVPQGIKVYLKAFDVDDPTPDSLDTTEHIIDPNDIGGIHQGNDNRGYDNLGFHQPPHFVSNGDVIVTCTGDANGIARLDNGELPKLQITDHPGDNVRVAAAITASDLSDLQVGDHRQLGYVPPSSVPPADFFGVISPMLTVWRKLNIEIDSMVAGPDSGSEKNFEEGVITAVSSGPGAGKSTVTLNVRLTGPADRYENGHLTIGNSSYKIVSNTDNPPLSGDDVIVMGEVPNSADGQSFKIKDDDDNLLTEFGLPEALPRNQYHKEIIKAIRPSYAPAYIQLEDAEELGLNKRKTIPFKLNEPSAQWLIGSTFNAAKDLSDSDPFWAFTVVFGYEGRTYEAHDPSSDDAVRGETPKSQYGFGSFGFTAIYTEVIRDKALTFDSSLVLDGILNTPVLLTRAKLDYYNLFYGSIAHEIGHSTGSQNETMDHLEEGLMDGIGPPITKPFSAATIRRFRDAKNWTH